MEMRMINLQRAEFKDTPKIKVKKRCSRLVHFAEISLQQLKMVLSSCMAPTCLYACLTMSGHAPNETTDGVLGYFLTDLDQGITELLDSLKCNLVASDGPKHNVPDRDGRYLIVCDIPVKILPTIRISLPAIITIKSSCLHISVCDSAERHRGRQTWNWGGVYR